MDAEWHRALPRARHLVRADPGDQPPHAGAGHQPLGEALGGAAEPLARPLPAGRGGGRGAPDVVPTGARRRGQDGARLDIRPLKDAALLEMGLWVKDGATPWQTLLAATRHGGRAVRGRGRARDRGSGQARRPHRGWRPIRWRHRQPPAPAPGPQGGAHRLGQARRRARGRLIASLAEAGYQRGGRLSRKEARPSVASSS